MASQSSLDWFRADTGIVDRGCSPFSLPSGALGLIPSETQPVTEVRGESQTSQRQIRTGTLPLDFLRHVNIESEMSSSSLGHF